MIAEGARDRQFGTLAELCRSAHVQHVDRDKVRSAPAPNALMERVGN
jgi:hypothetical protein